MPWATEDNTWSDNTTFFLHPHPYPPIWCLKSLCLLNYNLLTGSKLRVCKHSLSRLLSLWIYFATKGKPDEVNSRNALKLVIAHIKGSMSYLTSCLLSSIKTAGLQFGIYPVWAEDCVNWLILAHFRSFSSWMGNPMFWNAVQQYLSWVIMHRSISLHTGYN